MPIYKVKIVVRYIHKVTITCLKSSELLLESFVVIIVGGFLTVVLSLSLDVLFRGDRRGAMVRVVLTLVSVRIVDIDCNLIMI